MSEDCFWQGELRMDRICAAVSNSARKMKGVKAQYPEYAFYPPISVMIPSYIRLSSPAADGRSSPQGLPAHFALSFNGLLT
jgi:hypothetical protein